jgi:hypothetical protein
MGTFIEKKMWNKARECRYPSMSNKGSQKQLDNIMTVPIIKRVLLNFCAFLTVISALLQIQVYHTFILLHILPCRQMLFNGKTAGDFKRVQIA